MLMKCWGHEKGSGLGHRSSHSSNQMQRLASNIFGLEFVTCHRLCLTSSLLEGLLYLFAA